MKEINIAVVPVAGLGTRLLPATKSQPKEMLPVGRKPGVQYVAEELTRAGMKRLLFITGPGKTSIRAGFGMYYDLFGSGLITNFDRSAFGLTSYLVNPSGRLRLKDAPRYTNFTSVPSSIVVPAPKGGFPQQAPDLFAIVKLALQS